MNYEITESKKHTDNRGYLVEFLKDMELKDELKNFGQIYFVTFEKPGIVRGNHYHTKIYEWFGIASGIVEVVVEDIKTKERKNFILSADDKQFIRLRVGPYVAHAFKNLTPTAVLLDYASGSYKRENPDRQPYILLQEG